MGPVQAIKSCFRKYFTFSGRASRSEFWWFWGFALAASVLFSAFGLEGMADLFILATFIPWFAAACRRMHDTNRTGAFLLLPFGLMIVGLYTVLFSMLLPFSQIMNERLAGMDVSSETTIGELQKAQLEAISGFGFPVPSPWAFIVFFAALLWLAYLLARPSSPGTNNYGPSPSEVTP